ncbi:MAG: ABC transporter substrate binding protein [Xanthobacteraceae bacterium]
MAIYIRRREFIVTLGGAALWSLPARAQQPAMPVIGCLVVAGDSQAALATFLHGLQQVGYVEGHNVAIEARSADNHVERLPALATELVSRGVASIFATHGAASALASKAAISTVPIVFANGGDSVNLGLVSSLNRPGGRPGRGL